MICKSDFFKKFEYLIDKYKEFNFSLRITTLIYVLSKFRVFIHIFIMF